MNRSARTGRLRVLTLTGALLLAGLGVNAHGSSSAMVERPHFLIDDMDAGELKATLQQCSGGPFSKTEFSIGHRGAPLRFPEHTRESYVAAANQGAGILECDVTFTSDRQLVCRHSQCDLHTTTNILATELGAKCTQPFTPADPITATSATARCCTSDITLEEFKTLHGRMESADPSATTVERYMVGTPGDRPPPDATRGTLMTHAESIALFKKLDVGMTPELKAASVPMPFDGDYTQQAYAQQMIDEYRAAGVPPERVWPQSFRLDDVRYWLDAHPEFGGQAVFLDGRFDSGMVSPAQPETFEPTMQALAQEGVKIVAPPIWVLVTLDDDGDIVPSEYAKAASAAGLQIITWSLERSGSLATGGGYYYQSIAAAIDSDGDVFEVLDVLAKDVGVIGVFSDWPATVTYYANCMGLE